MTLKRRLYLLVIVVVVITVALFFVFRLEREPEYGGRKLSEWVEASVRRDPGEFRYETERAIYLIGTNALPYLLKWIGYEPRPWKSKLYQAVNALLGRINSSWQFTDKRAEKADAAMQALMRLGPRAAPVIGGLIELFNDPQARIGAVRAFNVLTQVDVRKISPRFQYSSSTLVVVLPQANASPNLIDPKSRPNLTRVILQSMLTNADWRVRFEATNAFRKIDPMAFHGGGQG